MLILSADVLSIGHQHPKLEDCFHYNFIAIVLIFDPTYNLTDQMQKQQPAFGASHPINVLRILVQFRLHSLMFKYKDSDLGISLLSTVTCKSNASKCAHKKVSL